VWVLIEANCRALARDDVKVQKPTLLLIFCLLMFTPIISSSNSHYLFQKAIADHAFPGGCLAIGNRHTIIKEKCYGYFTYEKKSRDKTSSEFDIASLTKVIATTPAIMKLYEQHRLKLDDKVVHYLPEFKGPTPHQTLLKSKITIRDLLTHSSGLPADREVNSWWALYRTPVVAKRHQRTIYSDINFLLLGKIVEKISGLNLDVFTHRYIFKPLNMNHTLFKPEVLKNIVPTAYLVKKHEFLCGVVNDPMARHFGGIAGNAGLFSTVHDLSLFAQMMLNQGLTPRGRLFKASTVRLFIARANIIKNGTRTLGWDTAYFPFAHHKIQHQFTAGLYADANAYGHSGYTGTSLWVSPRHGIFVLLLTNRVLHVPEKKMPRTDRYWRQQIDSAAWLDLGLHHKNCLYVEKRP
jgi:beta-N-acetylhexosaminidase